MQNKKLERGSAFSECSALWLSMSRDTEMNAGLRREMRPDKELEPRCPIQSEQK
jgi:hypothetical protein